MQIDKQASEYISEEKENKILFNDVKRCDLMSKTIIGNV